MNRQVERQIDNHIDRYNKICADRVKLRREGINTGHRDSGHVGLPFPPRERKEKFLEIIFWKKKKKKNFDIRPRWFHLRNVFSMRHLRVKTEHIFFRSGRWNCGIMWISDQRRGRRSCRAKPHLRDFFFFFVFLFLFLFFSSYVCGNCLFFYFYCVFLLLSFIVLYYLFLIVYSTAYFSLFLYLSICKYYAGTYFFYHNFKKWK